ncbi:tyrosine-type recombinase/integrase [Listeria sp. FSL L7-1485]|uniref:Tyrosine-type recombinase/integrase n=1 Tax=Listeria immobilis TaxID=2713502 RepID=A0A7X1CA98_9LIST|nr:tyrosine-type recombinase/integrase [Listeria immobilis]EAD1625644.1 site-specific integrase [Listeria monocytogenes]EAE3734175.1 site-specific integrase [Listeria monocytogenes]EAE3749722.1 site-specific integrase [Listeria monocytogenes]EAE5773713.1 site-specific integrase [Listeria monocytogenes]EAE6178450.1 site-specific integrase [Listeria monocytogenes]
MEEVQPIKNVEKIALMKTILSQGDFGERNVLLFSIGINTAYRISDLLSLKLRDVLEIYRQKVRVKSRLKMTEQKTEKNNSVILTKKLQKDIWDFVSKEHAEWIAQQDLDHYLFASRKTNGGEQPLSRQQGWYIISNAGKKAGLQHLGTHSMRKTFGYHLYKNGVGLELIQLLLNHSSPRITLRYIGIEQEDKDQAVSSLGL